MLKKLTQEQLAAVLEAGIAEFAEKGPERASMGAIARAGGLSVGVLYKYYADKEAFFSACLERSLDALRQALREIESRDGHILSGAEAAVRAVQRFAREHNDYLKLYLRLTADCAGPYARRLADEIEGISSELYRARIASARESGDVRDDLDPGLFAFFFDNLLMMLQFSYCSDYYRERFRCFCGGAAEDDELVAAQLLRFLESAFTFSRADVRHELREGEPS
jgi:TetR/AcrR family transcriptional regulator